MPLAHQTSARGSPETGPRVVAALRLLRDANEYAHEFDLTAWEFAVDLAELRDLGATKTDCRWLICKGLVEYAREISLPGEGRRSFQRVPGLKIVDPACFVITEAGLAYLADSGVAAGRSEGPRPTWDRQRHELHYGDRLVKQFKVPAPNQEAILDAFEEEGWPSRIDDPLSPKGIGDPKRRLHDTVNSLRRNQKHSLIRFYGDGTGQGICWEPA